MQAILRRNLIPRCPFADLFGVKSRCWLANQRLPVDEEFAVEALLRQLDFHRQELRIIDAALGRIALERLPPSVCWNHMPSTSRSPLIRTPSAR